MRNSKFRNLSSVLLLLFIFSSACASPSNGNNSEEVISPTQPLVENKEELPAAIVEVSPIPGSRLALDAGLTFYFNQEMDRASVEAAINGEPSLSGTFTWEDDRTVTFDPANAWFPDTEINFIVSKNAKAENGLSMQEAQSFSYRSSNYLEPIQKIPWPDVDNASPSSSVIVSFNQSVVSLGANPADLPAGFGLQPTVEGHGEWLNTSTYSFTPALSMQGGTEYKVLLNQDLVSLGGAPLTDELEDWSFTTDFPRVVTISTEDYQNTVPLDINPYINFNTAMNAEEIEAQFLMQGPDGKKVQGDFEWSNNNTTLRFNPTSNLERDVIYSINISDIYWTSFVSASEMRLLDQFPAEYNYGDPNNSFTITFSAELKNNVDYSDYIGIEPMPDGFTVNTAYNYQWNIQNNLRLSGNFDANTDYKVTVSEDLADKWGDKLGAEQVLSFSTGSYESNLNKYFYYRGMWADPSSPMMTGQAINISSIDMMVGSLTLDTLLAYERSYWRDDGYRPDDLRSWTYPLTLSSDIAHTVSVPLTPDGSSLEPGIYWLMASSDDLDTTYLSPSFVIASHINLVFKQSAKDVSVWAIDRRDQSPVSGEVVKVYDLEGNLIAQGLTNSEGLFYSETSPNSNNRYYQSIATMGEPGDEYFSLVSSDWAPYYTEFGSYYGQSFNTKSYVYTDRPIYRPGDTIHFRVILRDMFEGRYEIPELSSLLVKISYDYSKIVEEDEVQLSEFGTATSSFKLPSDAPTGHYWVEVNLPNCEENCSLGGVNVPVAAYVKPSVDLQVDILNDDAKPGDELIADTKIEFYFGQDAAGMNVEYRWYSTSAYFNIPGYSVGSINRYYSYFNPYASSYEAHEDGEASVDSQGNLQLSLEVEPSDKPRRYYFSVNLDEKAEQQIGGEDSVLVHPAEYYVGIKADSRVGKVDEEMGFEVIVVDWDLEPVGSKTMTAKYYEVAWEPVYSQYGFEGSEPVYTEIDTEDLEIGLDGEAQISFSTDTPGVYMIEVGDEMTISQTMVWVNGLERVSWKDVLYNRVELEKDKDNYEPGETAQIFIPNTFVGNAQALISIERDQILSQEIVDIDGSGMIYELYLDEYAAPNVYLSVSMIGINQQGVLSLAQGRVNIPVDPKNFELNLEVLGEPERSGPGEEVTISIRVTDIEGNPVEAEFSVAVVDKAIFALADPSEQNILDAFYDEIRHAVKTSGSLLVSTESEEENNSDDGGMGGGGGDALPSLRSDFKDTAFWIGEVVTNANGEAELKAVMPDNLSTWKILVRGITKDTKVGEAEIEILTTKELILRPVTPSFLVAGDHLEIGAFIHNNSASDLQVGTAIQLVGFNLDDPNTALQDMHIPTGERVWVSWWGTVEDVDAVKIIFAASGGGLSDITTPASGDIPVMSYLAKQAFATSGILEEATERLEVISLPVSVDPTEGSLKITLASSMAGAILPGLESLENNDYENIEATVSRFLPNLETYRVVQEFGITVPELEANLARNLEDSLFKLASSQNYDGGWAWTAGRESSPMLSAYALLGWTRAKQIGMDVNDEAYELASNYLLDYLAENINDFSSSSDYDRSAFIFYVLRLTGVVEAGNRLSLEIILAQIYGNRDLLNPSGLAFFAMALNEANPNDPLLPELFSNLKSMAIRSSTGAHWEEKYPSYGNMSSTLVNTSVVLYALANEDPSSPLVADAVRYLMAHRDVYGAWASNYATSWSVLSLVEVMRGTGELGGDFRFSSTLNSILLSSGSASGSNQFNLVSIETGIEDMHLNEPNVLRIKKEMGTGRLYYSAVLQVSQAVETVAPLDREIHIERTYTDPSVDCEDQICASITEAKIQNFVEVKLDLIVPNDLYYVVVEDFIPAGAEIVNKNLNIYNYYSDAKDSYNAQDPYADGWGWWYFDNPKIYYDHIYWMANYLPAGNYQLSYTLSLRTPGEFQVMPAHVEQLYFPDVQSNSAGEKFVILP